MSKKAKTMAIKADKTPNSEEQPALDSNPVLRVKVVTENNVSKLVIDYPDKAAASVLLKEALGSADTDFLLDLCRQVTWVSSAVPGVYEQRLNFIFSVIKSIKPKDQLEAMLAAQMAAVHLATMSFAGGLARVDTIPRQDSAGRLFIQLVRTYATQMEALKRYRTGGQQNVTVHHVSVGGGGQAIVGNVTQGPREPAPDKAAASPAALAESPTPAMMIMSEPASAAVPLRRRSSK
jgi:hypothetical protein